MSETEIKSINGISLCDSTAREGIETLKESIENGSIVEVVVNLTTDDATKALSAKQGKLLSSQLAALTETGVSPDASLINDTTATTVNTYSSSKIENLIANCAIANDVEPATIDIPRLYLSSVNGSTLPTTKTSTTMKFKYVSKSKQLDGYVDIKCQGNSSMSYPKKNFTIKLYSDVDKTTKQKVDFKGWGKQSKFVLKANWIDITHSLNIVSARLWGQIIKSRTGYDSIPELLRTSPNQGAVDGFPVMLYNCGEYWGRYTLNIPKDAWMANMDDELDTHCILCGENYDSGCFRSTASINGNDWTDELHDTVPTSIVTRWNQVISQVKDSTDANFIANLNSYIDVESAIDYYIFGVVSCGLDAFGKNQLYFTYNGQKWYASMYDMDSTWGLWWNGSEFVATTYPRSSFQDLNPETGVTKQGNCLYMRLESLFTARLKQRYTALRNDVLSAENIISEFEKFWDICPNDLLAEDYASTTGGGAFTNIPSKTSNTKQRIRAYIVDRLAYCDTYVNSLTAPVACTGLTLSASSLTFTSTTSQTLTATITPSDTTDTLTWTSSDETKATVSNGVVTPVANGTCTITATCGSQTATCSVTISGDVLYRLPSATTFDGIDDYIDTGVNLYSEPHKLYSIYVDFTGNLTKNTNSFVLHEVNEENPYYGFSLATCSWDDSIGRVNKYTVSTNGEQYVTSINSTSTENQKYVIVRDNTQILKIYSQSSTETPLGTIDYSTTTDTAITQNLLLGAYQNTSGAKGYFWTGTINNCIVYNRVLSSTEIQNLFSA